MARLKAPSERGVHPVDNEDEKLDTAIQEETRYQAMRIEAQKKEGDAFLALGRCIRGVRDLKQTLTDEQQQLDMEQERQKVLREELNGATADRVQAEKDEHGAKIRREVELIKRRMRDFPLSVQLKLAEKIVAEKGH
ncbi:hypothetical protein SLS58_004660 [Diplodia intermedia]|uniref:Uncharacterized protein n=1 Tax=Diplodia intermedia TaxID=856260 RepID=A0ABR3TSK3_9PEZI